MYTLSSRAKPHLPVPSQEPLHALGVVEQTVKRSQREEFEAGGHVLSHQQLTQLLHHAMLDQGIRTLASEASYAGHQLQPRLQMTHTQLPHW